MNATVTVAGTPGYKNRSTGLLVFGIIQILLGALCLLMLPLMALAMVMSKYVPDSGGASLQAGSMLVSLAFYLLLAAWFIVMGIGSIRARRWARALVLVVSWFWLFVGVASLAFMLLLLPNLLRMIRAESGQTAPGIFEVVFTVTMLGMLLVMYILIPGAFVLFYRSPHVRATCEARDPKVRWTDRCPLPVLGLSLALGFWALGMLSMGLYNWVLPFFGLLLSGWAGAAVVLASALLLGWIAWGAYRLQPSAWWGALLFVLLWATSLAATFSRVNFLEFYTRMKMPMEQIRLMQQYDILNNAMMLPAMLIWFVFGLGYLLYIRYHASVDKGSIGFQNPG